MHIALLGLLVMVQDAGALADLPAIETPSSQTQEEDQAPAEELTPADTQQQPLSQSQSKTAGSPRKKDTFSVVGLLVASAGLLAGALAALVGVLPAVGVAVGLGWASLGDPLGQISQQEAVGIAVLGSVCLSPFGFAFCGCLPGILTTTCCTVAGSVSFHDHGATSEGFFHDHGATRFPPGRGQSRCWGRA